MTNDGAARRPEEGATSLIDGDGLAAVEARTRTSAGTLVAPRPRQASRRAIGAALALSLLLTLIVVARASAEQRPVAGFGSEGAEAGQLSLPGGLAITPDGTRLLVADTENERIDEYDVVGPEVGQFVRAFGWGVEDGSPELQTCYAESECLKGLTGLGEGELNEPVGVAVSPSGATAYVIDRARKDGRIQKFGIAGGAVSYQGVLPAGYGEDEGGSVGFSYPLPNANDIAVGTSGTVYVGDNNAEKGARVVAFAGSGKPKEIPLAVGTITAIAVGGGKVFVGGEDGSITVIEKGAEGKRFEPKPELGEIKAVAFDPRSENLIVEPNALESFEPGSRDLVLTEVSPQGKVVGSISGLSVAEPDGPNSYGLVVDTKTQVEKAERYDYRRGAIFVADRYASEIQFLAEPIPDKPFVSPPSAQPQSTEAEKLSTSVTPRGFDTHAYFEYGTTTAYGTAIPAPPGFDVGDEFEERSISVQLTGLRPGTVYHYAVVASNAKGTVVSADRTFFTLPVEGPFSLPDERVWELVTTGKGSAEAQLEGAAHAASSGSAIAWENSFPLPGTEANVRRSTYVSSRGSTGWSTTGVSVPNLLNARGQQDNFLSLSSDLTRSVALTRDDLTGGSPPGPNLYLRDDVTGVETLITPYRGTTGESAESGFEGASPDFSHIVVASSGHLTPDTPSAAQNSLYDYTAGGLHDIGILPGAQTPTTGGIKAADPLAPYRVSEDGSHLFFEAEPEPRKVGEATAMQVYVRVDGVRTVEVSASQAARADAEAAEQPATFVGASSDGRYAFFTSSAELTIDAYTGERPTEGRRENPNLYRYDLDTGALLDLSVGTGAEDKATGAGVRGVVIAPDGRSAYFAAVGKLAPGATPGGANLYRWTQDGGATLVAGLSENDEFMDPFALGAQRSSRLSADASVLVFQSHKPLDPNYLGIGEELVETYRFSASERTFVCMSCTPFEAQPGYTVSMVPNALSSDGSRFFFETPVALVARDTNGQVDIYEWVGGAPHLITPGTGRRDATLLDAGSSGEDVFFITTQSLVRGDTDEVGDVYDARVRGGLPETGGPAEPCQGEACRSPVAAPPAAAPGGSHSFNGPANPRHKHHRKKHRKHRHRHSHHRRDHRKASSSQAHRAVGKQG